MVITISCVMFLRIRWNSSSHSVLYRKNRFSYNLWFLSDYDFHGNRTIRQMRTKNDCRKCPQRMSSNRTFLEIAPSVRFSLGWGRMAERSEKFRFEFSNLFETFLKLRFGPQIGGFSKDNWTSKEFMPLFLSW